MSNDTQEQQKTLEMEKKVMNSLFEEELNLEKKLKFEEKKEMSLVTQLPIEYVSKVLGKFDEYKSMHHVLRQMRLNNEPLPDNVKELQQLFMMNSASRQNRKYKYHQYKNVSPALPRYLCRHSAHHGPEDQTTQKDTRPRILPLITAAHQKHISSRYILKACNVTHQSRYSHQSPRLPYLAFNYSILSRITDCFLCRGRTYLFSLLLVLRRVSRRGTPSSLNSEDRFRSRKRS